MIFRGLNNLLTSIRWRKPSILILLAVREILRPIFYWHAWHIFETDISQHVPKPYAKEDVEVKIYTPEDNTLIIQKQISAMGELEPAEVGRRFARKDLIAIAVAREQPVGYMWMAFSHGLELAYDTYWTVRSHEEVRYGSFVIPAFRGRAIHSCLNAAVNSYLRNLGVIRSLASVSILNPPSMSLPKHYKRPISMTVFVAHIRGLNWTIRKSFRAPLESRFTWPKK
jgi:GNAT superfamily N-acetyltransferase